MIVKTGLGYQRYVFNGQRYVLEPGEEAVFSQAVLTMLNKSEREALGFATVADAPGFMPRWGHWLSVSAKRPPRHWACSPSSRASNRRCA